MKARTRTKPRAHPPALSRDRVIDAALALIDAQGVVLAQNLDRLENRAFIARWQNGAEVPRDDSFELFIDIAVAGLAQRVKPR